MYLSKCSVLAIVGIVVVGLGASEPLNAPIPTPTSAPQPANTACGDIVVKAQQGYRFFWASDAFECLKNVPFLPDVAQRFLDYYNDTLHFQSTLAFLKDPPADYQQPAVDVLSQLRLIGENIAAGAYQSQYVFEAEVQLLINRMHDAHVTLNAGVLSPFTFVSPYRLVSASPDGKKTPKVYLKDDILRSRTNSSFAPSPLTHINGVPAQEWLRTFAALESLGYLEPHADWNALMESPARDIQGDLSVIQAASFYPGDTLNFTIADGRQIKTRWLAIYNEHLPTGPITTAGDFYNYFVLGLTPDGFDPDSPTEWWPKEVDISTPTTNTTSPKPSKVPSNYGCPAANSTTKQNWCKVSYGAYPSSPDIVQRALSVTSGGVVTGYFLDDISTGVLSLPSFYQTGRDTPNFFETVDWFISNATEKNTTRIIIDLQQNTGGLTVLALSLFKRFFYAMEPWTGSRIRTHQAADILGIAYTSWWDSLEANGTQVDDPWYDFFASSEWVVGNRINPLTGTNFTSWAEYSGHVADRNDTFSRQQVYNLSDPVFSNAAFQGHYVFGYGPKADATLAQPWAPENIVLLTDGLCSSACALFVELMTHQAGVKTTVVGGMPKTGPMQAASGSRGARSYSSEALDFEYENVEEVLQNHTAAQRLQNRTDTGIWVTYAGINIRDSVRENESVPLQFKYQAADCRLYFTLQNVYNMSRLWRDVAAATWDNRSLCVEDSTGYPSTRNSNSTKPAPSRNAKAPSLLFDFPEAVTTTNRTSEHDSDNDVVNGNKRVSISAKDIVACGDGLPKCGAGRSCEWVTSRCNNRNDGKEVTYQACCPWCGDSQQGVVNACSAGMKCLKTDVAESKFNGDLGDIDLPPVYDGYCEPTYVDPVKSKKIGATCLKF